MGCRTKKGHGIVQLPVALKKGPQVLLPAARVALMARKLPQADSRKEKSTKEQQLQR